LNLKLLEGVGFMQALIDQPLGELP
jgi:hypothetical protein